MAKSRVNLTLEFEATGETPRLTAASIAKLVRDFLSVEMELAGADVSVTSAFLDYKTAYEAAVERFQRDGRN